jgi:hypothetical protein
MREQRESLSVIVLLPNKPHGGHSRAAILNDALSRASAYLKGYVAQWEIVVCAHLSDEEQEHLLIRQTSESGRVRVESSGVFSKAVEESRYDTVGVWEATSGVPAKEMGWLAAGLDDGFDVVIGSRFLAGESIIQRNRGRRSVIGERLLNLGLRIFCRVPVTDVVSGAYAFRKDRVPQASFKHAGTFLRWVLRQDIRFIEKGIMWIPPDPRVKLRTRLRDTCLTESTAP